MRYQASAFILFCLGMLSLHAEPLPALSCQRNLLVVPTEESAHELYMMGAGLYNSDYLSRAIVEELKARKLRNATDVLAALRSAAVLQSEGDLQTLARAIAWRLRNSIPTSFPAEHIAEARATAESLGLSYEDFLGFLAKWRAHLAEDPSNRQISQLIYYLLKEQSAVMAQRVEAYLGEHPLPRQWKWAELLRRLLETLRAPKSTPSTLSIPPIDTDLNMGQAVAELLESERSPLQMAEALDLFIQSKEDLTEEDLRSYVHFMLQHLLPIERRIQTAPVESLAQELRRHHFEEKLTPEDRYSPVIELELAILSKLLSKVAKRAPQTNFSPFIEVSLNRYMEEKRRVGFLTSNLCIRSEQAANTIKASFQNFLAALRPPAPALWEQNITLTQAVVRLRNSNMDIHEVIRELEVFVDKKEDLTEEDLRSYIHFMNSALSRLEPTFQSPLPQLEKQLRMRGFPEQINSEQRYSTMISVELAILSKLLWKVALKNPQSDYSTLITTALESHFVMKRVHAARYLGEAWRAAFSSNDIWSSFQFILREEVPSYLQIPSHRKWP
jgi:hypothetical protein